jgi:hypothetical protein
VFPRPGEHYPAAACRLTAASPKPQYCKPPTGLCLTRHTEVHSPFARPAFPLPVAARRHGSPSASTLSFAPQPGWTCWRTSGRGQALEHWPEATRPAYRASPRIAHSPRATSCRTARSNTAGPLGGSQRQTPMRARRHQASPASAGNHPRFSRAQGVTRRDIDDSYALPTSSSQGVTSSRCEYSSSYKGRW